MPAHRRTDRPGNIAGGLVPVVPAFRRPSMPGAWLTGTSFAPVSRSARRSPNLISTTPSSGPVQTMGPIAPCAVRLITEVYGPSPAHAGRFQSSHQSSRSLPPKIRQGHQPLTSHTENSPRGGKCWLAVTRFIRFRWWHNRQLAEGWQRCDRSRDELTGGRTGWPGGGIGCQAG